MGSGDGRGSSPMSKKNSKSPRREPHWMQVGLHMSYFLVISRFQQPKKQRSPFFLPDLM